MRILIAVLFAVIALAVAFAAEIPWPAALAIIVGLGIIAHLSTSRFQQG